MPTTEEKLWRIVAEQRKIIKQLEAHIEDLTSSRSITNLETEFDEKIRSVTALVLEEHEKTENEHHELNDYENDEQIKETEKLGKLESETETAEQSANFKFLTKHAEEVNISVAGSTPFLDRFGKEYFTFKIIVRIATVQQWICYKTYSDLLALYRCLHDVLAPKSAYNLKPLSCGEVKNTDYPAALELKRAAVESFLESILKQTDRHPAILSFLSEETEVRENKIFHLMSSLIEGYLHKRGKVMKTWKSRYYVLFPDALEWYASKENALAESLKSHRQPLGYFRIGNNTAIRLLNTETKFALVKESYMFAISESGTQRQKILCAASAEEAQEWVNAFISLDKNSASVMAIMNQPELLPISFMPIAKEGKKSIATPSSSRKVNGITPFIYTVLGDSLESVVAKTKITENYEIPSLVYRCIEYLEYHKCHKEEGIYRLSGTKLETERLAKLFADVKDVPLVGSNYDIHSVANLLKKFLRHLPENILTDHLRHKFVDIAAIENVDEQISQTAKLLEKLPVPNYTLLRTLLAHLIKIVKNAEESRMSVGNMCIVFCPTLAIPARILILMMTKFDKVFQVNECIENSNQNSVNYRNSVPDLFQKMEKFKQDILVSKADGDIKEPPFVDFVPPSLVR